MDKLTNGQKGRQPQFGQLILIDQTVESVDRLRLVGFFIQPDHRGLVLLNCKIGYERIISYGQNSDNQ